MSVEVHKDLKKEIRDQISIDLTLLLDQYKNRDIGLRIISEKTKVGEKTLKRILSHSSDPHANTVRSFYNYYFKVEKGQLPVHDKIRSSISKESILPNLMSYDESHEINLANLLATNKILRDIYIYSRTGYITKSWVIQEYGKYGMEIVQLMLDQNVLLEIDRNIFVQGPVNISKKPEALKKIISELVEDRLRVEKLEEYGSNSAFFLIEGISEAARDKVLDATEKYKQELVRIMFAKENRGDLRAYAVCAVDELNFDQEPMVH